LEDAPKIVFGRVAPVNLDELGNYIQRVGGVGLNLTDEDSQTYLREAAGLPHVDVATAPPLAPTTQQTTVEAPEPEEPA